MCVSNSAGQFKFICKFVTVSNTKKVKGYVFVQESDNTVTYYQYLINRSHNMVIKYVNSKA